MQVRAIIQTRHGPRAGPVRLSMWGVSGCGLHPTTVLWRFWAWVFGEPVSVRVVCPAYSVPLAGLQGAVAVPALGGPSLSCVMAVASGGLLPARAQSHPAGGPFGACPWGRCQWHPETLRVCQTPRRESGGRCRGAQGAGSASNLSSTRPRARLDATINRQAAAAIKRRRSPGSPAACLASPPDSP